jgi:hypothetical protein
LLVDDDGPVTLAQVYAAVEEAIDTEPERLLIFFAGHGSASALGDAWLLSDWERDPNQVINVNLSLNHAKRHPIRQIGMFSDACRSPVSEAAYLIGGTIFPSAGRDPDELPEIDLFHATRLGQIALGHVLKGPSRTGFSRNCCLPLSGAAKWMQLK